MFILLFTYLLTAPIFKKSHMYVRIYVLFLKTVLRHLESVLIPNFDLSVKIGKAVNK